MSEHKDPSHGVESPFTRVIEGVSITVTPSEPFHPSKDRVNAERFGGDAKDITEVIRMICEWVNMPILEDSFDDHADRRAWENGLDKPTRDWLDENKISGNQFSCPIMLLPAMLARPIRKHDASLAQKIELLAADIPSIQARFTRYKDEGRVARAALLGAISDLDTVCRNVVTAITS
jgi:hypothetical protein